MISPFYFSNYMQLPSDNFKFKPTKNQFKFYNHSILKVGTSNEFLDIIVPTVSFNHSIDLFDTSDNLIRSLCK